ncbi:hypothetical protein [Enterovibrio nigricans]|uniref:Uncharacterized protein n=1 Tax=Enterovibrio nigricans DSM 22720 TaxID=1121868 RepID=A0A1T4V665_9GAMM|nr:hypothetical protein [Enterovibrio nigricans]PKF49399.1 hypothetical protein AT251_19210 [Enterovibrio nigricans]SKA60384.1 hypothetical protein SAMN02745132_03298 [Enterovibrio nigricans DSM 22720]
MKEFLKTFTIEQLMSYEANVCHVARDLSGASGIGAFSWKNADGFPVIFTDSSEVYSTEKFHNFYCEVELSLKVFVAVSNLMVSNAMAWRYSTAQENQKNVNQELCDLYSEMYHSQRYWVMDSGVFTDDEIGQILKAID